ncbi:MAG: hypothetical protein ACXW27_09095 [Allosphingosinicella sp.]
MARMVKVEARRRHDNAYPPVFRKNPGRHYEVPEGEEKALLAAKLVRRPHKRAAKAAPLSLPPQTSEPDA